MNVQQSISKQNSQNDFDLQFHLIKRFFSSPRSDQVCIDQISAIIQQNKLLKNIQQQIQSKLSSSKIITEGDLDESINLSSSTLIYRPTLTKFIKRTSDHAAFWETKLDKVSTNTTLDDDIRIKRVSNPRIITQAEIDKAMSDVENNCDASTIQIIKHLFARSSEITKKLRQNQQTIQILHKNKKAGQQLKIAQMDYQKKILDYQNRIRGLQLQNNNLKQNTNSNRRYPLESNNQKQKQLSKMQISLVLKQKLIAQDLKKVNNKLTLLKKQQAFVLQNRKIAEEIWQNIINNLQVPGDQFKLNVYNKCKQSLMAQRKHLQEEQNQLDSQHQYIEKIIGQMQTIL